MATAAEKRAATLAAKKLTAEQYAIHVATKREMTYLSFAEYAKHMWSVVEPEECIWSPHMEIVCNEIQAVIEEADRRRRLFESLCDRYTGAELDEAVTRELGHLPRLRLTILIPPRMSKSTLVGRLLPSWRWLHRPQEQILILTAVDDLIERDGLRVRDTLKNAEYLAIQDHCVHRRYLAQPFGLRPDSYAKERFVTTEGGSRHGYTVGGRYTGVNADIVAMDDVHDLGDTFTHGSPASRLRAVMEVRSDYKDKIQDRLISQIWGIVLLIMQRVHPNDIADYMIEQGSKVVCLPGRYMADHPFAYKPGMGYVAKGRDFRTIEGQPLAPRRLPDNLMETMRIESPHGFATKIMMLPTVQEGVRFKKDWFSQRYGTALTWREEAHRIAAMLDEVVISVDAAATAKSTSDFCALHVWGRKGRKRVLLDRVYKQMEFAELLRSFDALCQEWPEATFKLIENKSNGITLITTRQATMTGIIPINPHGDKEARANYISFGDTFEKENGETDYPLWIPNAPWAEEYAQNMVGFGAGGIHDDDVDATSQVEERWAVGNRPWLSADMRSGITDLQHGTMAIDGRTKWGAQETGQSYFVGIVPGWANGQSEAVAAFVNARGRLVALVEIRNGGVDLFVTAVVEEAGTWGRVIGGRYAESLGGMSGLPANEVILGLVRQRVRISGVMGKMVGEKHAGYCGTKPEKASLWGSFLMCVAEGRCTITDGYTMARLETVIEQGGVPQMPDGGPLSGRVLAVLLALQAMRAVPMESAGLPQRFGYARTKVVEAKPDMWAVGMRRGR